MKMFMRQFRSVSIRNYCETEIKTRVGKPERGTDRQTHRQIDILFTPKKTEHDVEIVRIVNIFNRIRTIASLMRKDVPNPGKLVWGPYD